MIPVPLLLARHFDRLVTKCSGATLEMLSDKTGLIGVPDVALPSGWSMPSTPVWFLAPAGYPVARPDCFWATTGLRLASGGLPTSGRDSMRIGASAQTGYWFSWHIQDAPGKAAWDPQRDDLCTYMAVIRDRLGRPQ